MASIIKSLELASYILEELCRQCGQPIEVGAKDGLPAGVSLCLSCNHVFRQDKPAQWVLTADGITADGTPSGSAGLRVCTASTYAGPIQKLIRRLKYDDDTLVAKDIGPKLFLAYLLLAELNPEFRDRDGTRVVPVPLHKKRQRKRGYNQAHLIAREFARIANLTVDTEMLCRVKETQPQYGLKKNERLINVTDAFAPGAHAVSGRRIILVDDVFTSGATLLTCASLLSAQGATKVVALAAARAPFDRDKKRHDREV